MRTTTTEGPPPNLKSAGDPIHWTTDKHNDDRQVSFAEISPILVLDKIRSLYVVEGLDRSEARMDGFSRAPSGPTLLIPVTSIDYKIKLVPHFHDDTKLIALRMQYARA